MMPDKTQSQAVRMPVLSLATFDVVVTSWFMTISLLLCPFHLFVFPCPFILPYIWAVSSMIQGFIKWVPSASGWGRWVCEWDNLFLQYKQTRAWTPHIQLRKQSQCKRWSTAKESRWWHKGEWHMWMLPRGLRFPLVCFQLLWARVHFSPNPSLCFRILATVGMYAWQCLRRRKRSCPGIMSLGAAAGTQILPFSE